MEGVIVGGVLFGLLVYGIVTGFDDVINYDKFVENIREKMEEYKNDYY